MSEESKTSRLTMDEIIRLIEGVARDGDGADKFRALKFLANAESASVTLPPPMGDHEVIERLARLNKGLGMNIVRIAYKVAFPNAKLTVDESEPTIIPSHLSQEDRITIQHCVSIKALHRHFPEIKIRGAHAGYPRKSGREAQVRWCRDQATRILVHRQQQRMKAAENRDVGLTANNAGIPETPVES